MKINMKFQIGTPVYVVLADNKVKYGTITDIEEYNVDSWLFSWDDDMEPLPEQFYRIRLENGTTVFYTNLDINHTVFAALLKPNERVEVRRYYSKITNQPLSETGYVYAAKVNEDGIYYAICIDGEVMYFGEDALFDTIFPYEEEEKGDDSTPSKYKEGDLVYVERDYYIVAAIVHDYNYRTKEYTLTSNWQLFKVKEGDIYSTYEEAIRSDGI